MPRKKTPDPVLVALLDQQDKARATFERWYARLKRALTACEKARRKVRSLQRRIDRHETEKTSARAG